MIVNASFAFFFRVYLAVFCGALGVFFWSLLYKCSLHILVLFPCFNFLVYNFLFLMTWGVKNFKILAIGFLLFKNDFFDRF